MGLTKYQCKLIYENFGYNIANYEDYQKFIFHPSKHRISFKQVFLNKFTNINRFEDITNIS